MKAEEIYKALIAIEKDLYDHELRAGQIAAEAHLSHNQSAKNLFRYLILRSNDLRGIHDCLSDLGISSMRSAEGYVYSNIRNVLRLLSYVLKEAYTPATDIELIGYRQSKQILLENSRKMFGVGSEGDMTRIMVTLPLEAAVDKKLIKNLIKGGMEIARINLSHGDPGIWEKMLKNIRKVSEDFEKNVKIYMDLSGPKIRTSNIRVLSKKGKIKNSIKLKPGDHLLLTKRETLGKQTLYNDEKEIVQMAEVGVMLSEIIDDLKIEDIIYFDDGVIKAVVRSKTECDVEIEVVEAYKSKLSANKGINLPNTQLNLPSLTDRDKMFLPFVCEHADMVGYSFVRTKEDVRNMYLELDKYGRQDLGVVFKIENQEAFDNLPAILFEGMKRENIAVMIARGDLAVELGFERISEVQDEILWLCEAAHIPVIWATQVLENLAKTGMATRAEVTDAAHSASAECVMLNKGPYIVEAVRTLKRILEKMGSHRSKKKSLLRPLNVAKSSIDELVKG